MTTVILFNKPHDVLSQFTDKGSAGSPRKTLSDYIEFPGVYPAGRLDRDSEGLMVLTDDGGLQARITQPRAKMAKTYLAHPPRRGPPHRPARDLAARAAGPVPQIGARCLDRADPDRGPQPPGQAHDRRGGSADPAPDPLAHRGLEP